MHLQYDIIEAVIVLASITQSSWSMFFMFGEMDTNWKHQCLVQYFMFLYFVLLKCFVSRITINNYAWHLEIYSVLNWMLQKYTSYLMDMGVVPWVRLFIRIIGRSTVLLEDQLCCWKINGILRRLAVLKTIYWNRWKLPIKENNCKKMTT